MPAVARNNFGAETCTPNPRSARWSSATAPAPPSRAISADRHPKPDWLGHHGALGNSLIDDHTLHEHGFVDEWPQWTAETVLNTGLPVLPPGELPPGAQVPVAIVERDGLAFIMSIFRDNEDDEDVGEDDDDWDGDEFSVDIETWVRSASAGWVWLSCGGSDWPLPFGQRPDDPTAALTGFAVMHTVDDSDIVAASGIAGGPVHAVRVTSGSGTTEARLRTTLRRVPDRGGARRGGALSARARRGASRGTDSRDRPLTYRTADRLGLSPRVLGQPDEIALCRDYCTPRSRRSTRRCY